MKFLLVVGNATALGNPSGRQVRIPPEVSFFCKCNAIRCSRVVPIKTIQSSFHASLQEAQPTKRIRVWTKATRYWIFENLSPSAHTAQSAGGFATTSMKRPGVQLHTFCEICPLSFTCRIWDGWRFSSRISKNLQYVQWQKSNQYHRFDLTLVRLGCPESFRLMSGTMCS